MASQGRAGLPKEVCRLCVQDGDLVWLFDGSQDASIKDVILVTVGVKMLPSDEITQKVCTKCLMVVQKMHQFRTAAIRNDQQLRKEHDRLTLDEDSDEASMGTASPDLTQPKSSTVFDLCSESEEERPLNKVEHVIELDDSDSDLEIIETENLSWNVIKILQQVEKRLAELKSAEGACREEQLAKALEPLCSILKTIILRLEDPKEEKPASPPSKKPKISTPEAKEDEESQNLQDLKSAMETVEEVLKTNPLGTQMKELQVNLNKLQSDFQAQHRRSQRLSLKKMQPQKKEKQEEKPKRLKKPPRKKMGCQMKFNKPIAEVIEDCIEGSKRSWSSLFNNQKKKPSVPSPSGGLTLELLALVPSMDEQRKDNNLSSIIDPSILEPVCEVVCDEAFTEKKAPPPATKEHPTPMEITRKFVEVDLKTNKVKEKEKRAAKSPTPSEDHTSSSDESDHRIPTLRKSQRIRSESYQKKLRMKNAPPAPPAPPPERDIPVIQPCVPDHQYALSHIPDDLYLSKSQRRSQPIITLTNSKIGDWEERLEDLANLMGVTCRDAFIEDILKSYDIPTPPSQLFNVRTGCTFEKLTTLLTQYKLPVKIHFQQGKKCEAKFAHNTNIEKKDNAMDLWTVTGALNIVASMSTFDSQLVDLEKPRYAEPIRKTQPKTTALIKVPAPPTNARPTPVLKAHTALTIDNRTVIFNKGMECFSIGRAEAIRVRNVSELK